MDLLLVGFWLQSYGKTRAMQKKNVSFSFYIAECQ